MKLEIRNSKSEGRSRNSARELREGSARVYDLEGRTLQFARDVRAFVKTLPRGIGNNQDIKQLVRASGSIGANYIEANEAVSRKDFILRAKISRKESKETVYWLQLVDTGANTRLDATRRSLIQEATELMKIFGAIVRKSQ